MIWVILAWPLCGVAVWVATIYLLWEYNEPKIIKEACTMLPVCILLGPIPITYIIEDEIKFNREIKKIKGRLPWDRTR